MNDFYNSYKIRICGTIRANRGLPKQLKNPKLKPGQMIYRCKGEILQFYKRGIIKRKT